jgi:hypothetical protein
MVVQNLVPMLVAERLAQKGVRDTRREGVLNKQQSAPAASGTNVTLVNGADFTKLISVAFDRTVGAGDNSPVTLHVNPFLIQAAQDPSSYYLQNEYEKTHNRWLRSFEGTVSFGGQGDPFDRDGDGTVDEALDADKLDDIVAWEVRWQLPWFTRDRRDRKNFEKFVEVSRASEGLAELQNATAALLSTSTGPLEEFNRGPVAYDELGNPRVRDGRELRNRDCYDPDELLAQAWFVEKLDAVVVAEQNLRKSFDDAAEQIDNAMIWTIVGTGVSRGEEFGADRYGAGVRGSARGFTLNLDWLLMEGQLDQSDSNQVKLGLEYGTQILQGMPLLYDNNGLDVAVSVLAEFFDDVPDAKHDSNLKLQTRLAIPIAQGVTVPLSLTWANHEDLFSDGDEVFGHIGLNFDIDGLLAPNAGG